jgi:hypothetical protein
LAQKIQVDIFLDYCEVQKRHKNRRGRTSMSVEEGDERSPHSSGSFSQPSSSYGATYQSIPASPTSRRQEEEKRMSHLEERHQQLNAMFGIKPFKSHISRRRVGDRSPELRELYDESKTFSSLPGMHTYLAFLYTTKLSSEWIVYQTLFILG